MAYESKERKAVLVMPDVGIPEDKMEALKSEFQNSIVGTLKRSGALAQDVIIVVVIVVIF